MNKHFSYLLDDDSKDFFQKVAEEYAVSTIRVARPRVALEAIEKVAAHVSSFEKIASALDRDIGIIKTAGSCGLDFGATRRASAYMSRYDLDQSISDVEYIRVFDKVATASLEADLESARDDLHFEFPAELHDDIDAMLGKVAAESIFGFIEDAEAFLGEDFDKYAGIIGSIAKKWSARKAERLAAKAVTGGATRAAEGAAAAGATRAAASGTARSVGAAGVERGAAARTGRMRKAWSWARTGDAPKRAIRNSTKINPSARQSFSQWRATRNTRIRNDLSTKIESARDARVSALKSHGTAAAADDAAGMVGAKRNMKKFDKKITKMEKKHGKYSRRRDKAVNIRDSKGAAAAKKDIEEAGRASSGRQGAAQAAEDATESATAAGGTPSTPSPRPTPNPGPAAGGVRYTVPDGSHGNIRRPGAGAQREPSVISIKDDLKNARNKNVSAADSLKNSQGRRAAARNEPGGTRETTDGTKFTIDEDGFRNAKGERIKGEAPKAPTPPATPAPKAEADAKPAGGGRETANQRADRLAAGTDESGSSSNTVTNPDDKGPQSLIGKAYDKGWKSLKDDEKSKLVMQGIGGAAAYKVLKD